MSQKKRKRESSIIEYPPNTKNLILPDKSMQCYNTTQTTNLSVISAQDSTTNVKVFVPFWNEYSLDWSQRLWLPIKTGYVDSDLSSLNKCVLGTGQKSWFTTRLIQPQKKSYNKTCSRLSPSLLREIMEKQQQETEEKDVKKEKGKKPPKKKTEERKQYSEDSRSDSVRENEKD